MTRILLLQKIVIILFFIYSSFYFFNKLYLNRNIFFEVANSEIYKKKFDQSQWIITNKNKKIISDSDLYTHFGFEYIKGIDPTTQNFEVPPLSKYLVGSSIVLFFNQRIFSLIFSIACILLIFYLVFVNTSSLYPSLLAVSLTMTNWLFLDQIINSPQLEIYQLYFLLNFFILFMLYMKKREKLYLLFLGLAAGGFSSIKFFFAHYLLIMILIISYYIVSKIKLKKLLVDIFVINICIFSIYIIYYFRFFYLGGTLIRFIQVQKWIIGFYLKSGINTAKIFASYLPLIYINRWQFWSEGYPIIRSTHWVITWPIIHFLGVFSIIYLHLKKYIFKNIFTKLCILFIVIYSIFLLFIPIWPRYLLLLYIPFFITISITINLIFKTKSPILRRGFLKR